MSENDTRPDLAPGDSVVDREDEDPDEAIVVWRPDDRTIADWSYEADGETITTAEENPEYPEDEPLAVVVFRTALENDWPDWENADAGALYEGTAERGITQYGFPETRLEPIQPGELEAQWLSGLADRLGDAGWDVTREPTELVVEQYDEQYRVTADGTVEGDGRYRGPLETLVGKEQD
jgi:hypothetical protein